MDLTVAAFSCGATRIATMLLDPAPQGYSGNYHEQIAHRADSTASALLFQNTGYRINAQRVVANLVSKLNAVTVNGQTGSILDNSLVTWTFECGPQTHQHDNAALITFGSLSGFFNTGNYVDYRNLANMGLRSNAFPGRRPGVPIQRFWANMLQGYGYTRAEYERNNRPGYSDSSLNQFTSSYSNALMNSLSDRLPIIT